MPRITSKNSKHSAVNRRSFPEQVTYDEYCKAMKEIIMYNSLTASQINGMDEEQLSAWETKKDKAWEVKRLYLALKNKFN